MSFDIKYDKDGMPITQKVAPNVEQTLHVESSEPEFEATQSADTNEAQFEQPEVEEVVEDSHEEVPTPAPKKADNAANIRMLREKAERAEKAEREMERIKRERDEMAQYLEELRHQQQYHAQPQQQEDVEEDYTINVKDDDLVEGKEIAKLVKKINHLEKQVKKSKQESSQMSVETRLKLQYPDIEKVLSQENLARLRQEEPELAYTISVNPDLYSQYVTAYKQVKRLGIYKDPLVFESDKQVIKNNISKPRPAVSINAQKGDTPLSRANAFANGLTEELKRQLQKEMADIRKGY